MHEQPRSSFNLLEQPWLPATRVSGATKLVSLNELLLSPEQFTGLATAVPVEFLSLHRMLLAICHRAIGPADPAQRASLLDQWPVERVEDYLKHWRERFDLFHPDRPFMQVSALRDAEGLQGKPWTQLALDCSSGNAKLLFDHSLDERPGSVEPDRAARLLLSHLQFTPGGLVKALRTSGKRGAACGLQVVLPLGGNLWETLALGLIPQRATEYEKDRPPWEEDPPRVAVLKSPPEQVAWGPAQRYTWLSRAVLLLPEADDTVRSVLYAEGLNLADDPVPDPMSALVSRGEKTLPLLIDAGRAFWRDLHALAGEGGSTPPRILAHAIGLRADRDDYSPVELAAGGLLPEQARIVMWRLEERRLAPEVIRVGGSGAARIDAAVGRAQEVGQSLYGALMDLCREWLALGSDRDPAKADVRALMDRLNGLPQYWGDLEPRFWEFADHLGRGDPPDACLEAWHKDVHQSVARCWRVATTFLGNDGRALAAEARAASSLRLALHRALKS